MRNYIIGVLLFGLLYLGVYVPSSFYVVSLIDVAPEQIGAGDYLIGLIGAVLGFPMIYVDRWLNVGDYIKEPLGDTNAMFLVMGVEAVLNAIVWGFVLTWACRKIVSKR